jgi:hypothetical protein
MKKCGICRAPYRVGVLVWTMKEGKLVAVRACHNCERASVTIHVAQTLPLCACGARATTCVGCCAKAATKHASEAKGIPAAIARLEGMVKAHKSGLPAKYRDQTEKDAARLLAAWVEGVESALELLKTGRF